MEDTHHKEAGRKGGNTCYQRYGKEYMAEIARRGGKKTSSQVDMKALSEKAVARRRQIAKEKSEV